MAIINCSECNSQISDKALACPKCGATSSAKLKHIKSITELSNSEKKSKAKTRLVLIAVGIAFILSTGGFLIMQNKNQESSPWLQTIEKEKQDSLQEMYKQQSISDSIAALGTPLTEKNKKPSVQSSGKNKNASDGKNKIRNNWSALITVVRSGYTYREIGGIHDLFITVTNNTDYVLDHVETQISYIKTNGDIYKTETIPFFNIQPHSWMRNAAPDSKRGTRVGYLEIINIKSTGLNFCYSPGTWANNSPDPYKCK